MKNAITVIDQELIDFFESKVDEGCDNYDFEDLNELLQMAKDLIGINAELTKREQKYKKALRLFISLSADAIREFGDELKGDSDE